MSVKPCTSDLGRSFCVSVMLFVHTSFWSSDIYCYRHILFCGAVDGGILVTSVSTSWQRIRLHPVAIRLRMASIPLLLLYPEVTYTSQSSLHSIKPDLCTSQTAFLYSLLYLESTVSFLRYILHCHEVCFSFVQPFSEHEELDRQKVSPWKSQLNFISANCVFNPGIEPTCWFLNRP